MDAVSVVKYDKVKNNKKVFVNLETNNQIEINQESDLSLIEKAKHGDVEAYKTIVLRYQSKAYSIAKNVIKNPSDAEDIVQEAFIKAYRNLAGFRGDSSFYTWFYRIIFNLAIDLSRKKYRHVETGVGDSFELSKLKNNSTLNDNFQSKMEGPEEIVYRSELQEQINKALNELSAEHRTMIVLREVDGFSYNEISEIAGCSLGTVMSRLHHARKKLQQALLKRDVYQKTNLVNLKR